MHALGPTALEPVRSVRVVGGLRREGLAERLAPVYQAVAGLAAALPPERALIGFAGGALDGRDNMVDRRGGGQDEVKRWV